MPTAVVMGWTREDLPEGQQMGQQKGRQMGSRMGYRVGSRMSWRMAWRLLRTILRPEPVWLATPAPRLLEVQYEDTPTVPAPVRALTPVGRVGLVTT